MHRLAWLPIALTLALPSVAAGQDVAAMPHAFLFGAWVGGTFPPPTTLTAKECLAAPAVIFTKDVVLRAEPHDATYSQSLVETVRGTGTGLEFRLVPAHGAPPPRSSFGLGQPALGDPLGFGCGEPNLLRVLKRGENEIAFPNCREYPYPLVRCTA